MKTTISSLLFLVASLSTVCAQSTFMKKYQNGQFNAILPLEDGGFLLAGSCPDSLPGLSDALMVRTDAEGNAIWSKRYGKKGFNEKIQAIQKHPNGGFSLSGILERRVGPFQNLREDMLLVRLGSNGEILWTRSVGDDDDDEQSHSLKVTPNGYFVIGRTFSDSSQYMAPCVFQLDSSGNYLSHNLVEDQDDDDYLLSWAPTSDGGFIGCGSTRSYGVGNGHIYLIRYNAQGDVVWTKTHAAPGLKSLAASIIPAGSGSFLIGGFGEVQTEQFTRSYDFMAMKITENGDSLWSRCYGNSAEDRASSIAPTPDGGYVLAGYTYSNSLGGSDVFLVRINANGDTLWTRRHASAGNDAANAVAVLPDGSIVWAGQWDESSDGSFAVLTKCTPDGRSCFSQNASAGIFATAFQFETFSNPVLHVVNPHSRADTLNFQGSPNSEAFCVNSIRGPLAEDATPRVYPNPSGAEFRVFSADLLQSVQITDAAGKTRFFEKVSGNEISISENTPGLYFLKIRTVGGTFSHKVLIQK